METAIPAGEASLRLAVSTSSAQDSASRVLDIAFGLDMVIVSDVDVTNPARIRSIGTVSLDAAGTFDFVASLGNRAELIRFRDGQQDAVLDLSNVNAPALRAAESLLGRSDWRDARGYQLAGPAGLETLSAPVDAAQIRDRVTNDDTGTSFLLTDAGIYVIRRPNVERDKERLEDERR